jgi:hypothetical protein
MLQAFIAKSELLTRTASSGLVVRPLFGPLAILPLVPEAGKQLNIPSLPLTDDALEALPAIREAGAALSQSGKVVYVEAEYFGGTGTQANCLFENGVLINEPTVHDNAINEALRFLGVEIAGAIDEFATVGLNRFRSTERWVSDT